MSVSKTNGSPPPSVADRDPVLTADKNGQRHFSQMAWINKRPTTSTIWKPPSKPRMAPDSSKGAHQPHLRRSDSQHEALGKQGHNEQRNTDQ
jgi:hypothetical protein